MRLSLLTITAALIALPVGFAVADDAVINTPDILASLRGDWKLQPEEPDAYKQRLHFGESACGQWQQSARPLPVNITFYVEGNELLLQHYYEPDQPLNYRLRQLRFRYELNGDTLTLAGDDGRTVWKRVPAEKEPDEKPELTLHETRVTESRSIFAIETNSTDAQIGVVVAVRIAQLADERRFQYFAGREAPVGVAEVEFFDKRPEGRGDDDPPVFDVRLLMQLIEQSDR